MKKLIRWTATYETLVEIPEGADEQEIAASIPLTVPGSLYQSDTWEVEGIYEPTEDDIAVHDAISVD
jgi:hypothetical protein